MARLSASRRRPKRLVCIVEGHGEVESIPNLCARIRNQLEAYDWVIDPQPVRQPRGQIVDEGVASPNRPPSERLNAAVALAMARPADGVLVLCDSDDDCAAYWGSRATAAVQAMSSGGAVMAVREYESWILAARPAQVAALGIADLEQIRDAKSVLRTIQADYRPTTHQLLLTRQMDVATAWAASNSFDKLVRTLAGIFGVGPIVRPLLQ